MLAHKVKGGRNGRLGATQLGAAVVVAVALLALAVAAPASATVTLAMNLSELVTASEQVVVASCIEEETRWDDRGRIVTDVTLEVHETMKGSMGSGEQLVVRRLGGAIGDLGMRVEGEPHFEVGERNLVFARRSTVGDYHRPVGMSQGVLRVQAEAGRDMVMPGGGGLALVQQSTGGQLRHAPAALLHPRPLSELRTEILRLVSEQRGQ